MQKFFFIFFFNRLKDVRRLNFFAPQNPYAYYDFAGVFVKRVFVFFVKEALVPGCLKKEEALVPSCLQKRQMLL